MFFFLFFRFYTRPILEIYQVSMRYAILCVSFKPQSLSSVPAFLFVRSIFMCSVLVVISSQESIFLPLKLLLHFNISLLQSWILITAVDNQEFNLGLLLFLVFSFPWFFSYLYKTFVFFANIGCFFYSHNLKYIGKINKTNSVFFFTPNYSQQQRVSSLYEIYIGCHHFMLFVRCRLILYHVIC